MLISLVFQKDFLIYNQDKQDVYLATKSNSEVQMLPILPLNPLPNNSSFNNFDKNELSYHS